MPGGQDVLERADAAEIRYAERWMRRTLINGGYSEPEIAAITEVFMGFLEDRRSPTPVEVKAALLARGLGAWDADVIAEAFAKL
ncbi:MAG: hypothetical protein ACFE0R_07970 [Salinarimonas sp.]